MYVGVWEPQHSQLHIFSLAYEDRRLVCSRVTSLGWASIGIMVHNDYCRTVKYLLPLGDIMLSVTDRITKQTSQQPYTEIESYTIGVLNFILAN